MFRVLTSIAIALYFIGYPFLNLSKNFHSHASVTAAHSRGPSIPGCTPDSSRGVDRSFRTAPEIERLRCRRESLPANRGQRHEPIPTGRGPAGPAVALHRSARLRSASPFRTRSLAEA